MKKLLIMTLFVANAGCQKDPPSIAPDPPLPTYTITASAGINGSVTPTSMTVNSGESATFTYTPDTGYRVSSITVDGITTADSTSSSTTITLKNIKSSHNISATFTDSLLYSQLDSIKSLIVGEWATARMQYKPTGDVFTDWYDYTPQSCEADDWEVYGETSYEAHQNGTLCSGGFSTDVYYVGTWKLSPNGKKTILTLTEDGTVLSSELVSVTRDTMVSIFVDASTHYSWKYTSIRHHH